MRASLLAVPALLLVAVPATAQRSLEGVEIKVEQVAPGVAVLFGAGGNIGLSHGADGNILIDDQFAPLTEKIAAAVATLDPDPVRFVINTHWHGDHTGGNENFAERGAVVVAHDNVRRRMSTEQLREVGQAPTPPSPEGALPVVTFDDGVTFHLNGDTIRAVHVAHAHTDGDALVYWTDANVLHMGDTFFNGMLPFIDLASGGSIDGAIRAVEKALAMTNEKSVIIPGHGPIAARADLVRYRDMLATLRTDIAARIAAGHTLDEIKADRLADAYGKPDDFISPDEFIEAVYESLTAEPHGH